MLITFGNLCDLYTWPVYVMDYKPNSTCEVKLIKQILEISLKAQLFKVSKNQNVIIWHIM